MSDGTKLGLMTRVLVLFVLIIFFSRRGMKRFIMTMNVIMYVNHYDMIYDDDGAISSCKSQNSEYFSL